MVGYKLGIRGNGSCATPGGMVDTCRCPTSLLRGGGNNENARHAEIVRSRSVSRSTGQTHTVGPINNDELPSRFDRQVIRFGRG